MEKLLKALRQDFPQITFTIGDAFCWSPVTSEVFYKTNYKQEDNAKFSILHEVAHALLGHKQYASDYQLLQIEMAAWEFASKLAESYSLIIDDNHIQNCLDTYRDWLYRRSICPNCSSKSIQSDDLAYYQCFNCHSRWSVATSKFCRPYRQYSINKKSPATAVASDSY